MNKSIIPQIFSGSKSNQIQSQDYVTLSKFESNDKETLLKEVKKNQDKNEESEKVQFSVQYSVFENEIEKQSAENLGQSNKLAYPNPIKQIRIPFDKIQFILQPILNEGILQCQIRKIRSSKQNSKYEMSIFEYPMLTAEQIDIKQKKKIIFKSTGINYFAGKIKWDKYGQNFIFLDNKINPKKCSTISMHRLCIGGANYQKNGLKKPHKIKVYLPEITQSNQMFEYRQQKFQFFEKQRSRILFRSKDVCFTILQQSFDSVVQEFIIYFFFWGKLKKDYTISISNGRSHLCRPFRQLCHVSYLELLIDLIIDIYIINQYSLICSLILNSQKMLKNLPTKILNLVKDNNRKVDRMSQSFQRKQKKSLNKKQQSIQELQKEIEIQKKYAEIEIKQNDEMVESLVQFNSDPEQEDTIKYTNPLVDTQNKQEEQKPQQYTKPLPTLEFQELSVLQNNKQYKKKLGQNESTYGQDFELEIEKFAIIGNNHNQYYEPGQQLSQDDSLPQLSKQNHKIQFVQSENQETRPKENIAQDDEVIIQKQTNQEEENIIQNNNNYQELQEIIVQDEDENVDDDGLLSQQQKEQEIRKELKQQHDKVQMDLTNDTSEIIEQQQSKQEIQQVHQEQPKQTCPYPKPLPSIEFPHGKKHFLLNPAPKGGMIQCTIKRDRSGMSRFYPKYHLHLSNGFLYLMSAKKRACNNTSNYIISMSREDLEKGNNFIGKVRSNFMGTEFVLYDAGLNPDKTKDQSKLRQQLGIVQYESNILGSKGPRKMVVLMPNLDAEDQLYVFKPTNSKDGILKEFQNNNRDHIATYVNRPPQWNSKHKAFVLNFYQRVDKPSVKNFQLIVDNKEDNILLQFGRVGDDLFNLDFQYPITPLQAFQIALTSFDYKIACE
ncbi:unnamed protein product (macronuclear) [Paramecium tetraurelia]|uniref:Tubby C-terminal domain-containing protein n=1 Tax=Paramecium tetraurelia TaxID=5888 RepID=A0DFE0_PARTE|nr:uncharacterized protein GSPATT00016570001 [Paramecium tetraurelia]CAK81757.1 unnamed protein product [Paramecium tetraurelia]|eukprot:XP_001449154.1 hypothetical protein (macronuclear) [Paramecium tetraurelia strain d4-2]